MNLLIPIVGQDPGPEYASDVNSSLLIIDQHNHTPGSGVAITPAAININADLAFNGNNAISLNSVRFTPLLSPIPATGVNLGCIYVAGVDLYYNDESGNQIQLTKSGAVAGTPGSISGLVSPASASYNSVSGTFVFESGTNTPAYIDGASIILRNFTANSQGLTLNPPPAMASSYSLTLPVLPASTLPVQLSNTGQFSTGVIQLNQLSTAVQEMLTNAPTIQILTGSGTYTAPTSPAPIYLRVRMIGGGGGGAGDDGGAGSSGGVTTFGTGLLTANGGTSTASAVGAVGGTATITAPAYGLAVQGGYGGSGGNNAGASTYPIGGTGGVSPFGGAGTGGSGASGGTGVAAIPATGSGGGGGSGAVTATDQGGAGGGAGGYIDAIIPTPSATYPYVVGAGGAGGIGLNTDGGAGGSGTIIVEEFY